MCLQGHQGFESLPLRQTFTPSLPRITKISNRESGSCTRLGETEQVSSCQLHQPNRREEAGSNAHAGILLVKVVHEHPDDLVEVFAHVLVKARVVSPGAFLELRPCPRGTCPLCRPYLVPSPNESV